MEYFSFWNWEIWKTNHTFWIKATFSYFRFIVFFLQFLLYRFGYKDKVKQTGALPRLSEDAAKIENQRIFEPEAQFAPCRALAGQNDYIDILGKFIHQNTVAINELLCMKNAGAQIKVKKQNCWAKTSPKKWTYEFVFLCSG